jgi:hypothetical protein
MFKNLIKITNRRSFSTTFFNRNTEKSLTNSDVMQILDIEKEMPKLTAAEQMYVKKYQNLNKKRFEKVMKTKKYGRIIGITLGTFVLTVYFYTMFAIKQEKFLDDFDLPDPVPEEKSSKSIKH